MSTSFEIITRDFLEEVTEPRWLVENLIMRNSQNLLIGPRGSFKSFVALDIALSVATGGEEAITEFDLPGPWEGCWPCIEPCDLPVLYAAGEGYRGIKERVLAWEQKHLDGERADQFLLVPGVPRPTPESVEAFIEEAKGFHDEIGLVVLDTVGRCLQGMDENRQQDASAFSWMVERIIEELNCAVIATHHSGHEKTRGRGSSVFGADADAEFILTRDKDELLVSMKNTKQRDAPEWDEDKLIQLELVQFEYGSSLCASNALSRPEADKPPMARTRRTRRSKQRLQLDRIANSALEILREHDDEDFTTNRLARCLAQHDHNGNSLELSKETIRQTYLTQLQDLHIYPVSQCWDAHSGKWRYVEPDH
ncbi:MAG: AAA family ATPase [Magnetovibrionaceae bacterium]